jgi:hypothetical protein
MTSLVHRLGKIEQLIAPATSAPRRVFRVIVDQSDDEASRQRKMVDAGWNPRGADLCIARVIVPASAPNRRMPCV